LYHATRSKYNRQTSMPPGIFESALPGSYRPKTRAIDRKPSELAKTNLW